MQRTSTTPATLVGVALSLTTLAAVAVGLSSLTGCGPEKSLPGVDTVATDRGEKPTAEVPAASEEKARQVVDRAVKAMTDGHPERLQKTKVNRSTAKGHYYKPVNGQFQFVETNRQFQAVYPNQIRVDYEFTAEGGRTNTIGLRRPAGAWFRDSAAPSPVQDPQQFAEMVGVDAIGTHWMVTLTPLTDPQVVAYGFAPASAGGRPFDTVKVAIPGYPVVYTLWFDQASGLLARVAFTNFVVGTKVDKELAVSEHKPFAGLTLPTKISYTHNGQTAETWTVDTWEFPDRIDDAVFVEPK